MAIVKQLPAAVMRC